MKDLSSVSRKEQTDLFNSFDYVFCDVDGVIWHFNENIPGAVDAIKTLQNKGKKIVFVSNNSTKSHDVYFNQLKAAGLTLEKSDLIRPPDAIIDFLKKRNFSQEIYLLGMTPLRTELETAGFKVETFDFENPEESTIKYVKGSLTLNKNIGAVIADLDVNMTSIKMQRAALHLANPEVLFITGGSDKRLCFGKGNIVIGPGCYHDILEDFSGRKATCLAKPSSDFNNFIKRRFKIEDSSRVLFVGDSIPEDMGFATNSGYRKLLVLSGLTSKEAVENWWFPQEFKPDYYVDNLKMVGDMLS